MAGRLKVLVDTKRRGSENMAIDEANLARGEALLRLYAWEPACVSLGYAQPESSLDHGAVERFGFDVVRRSTGGGAILHNETEVTYSIVVPHGFPGLPSGLQDSFKFLSSGVFKAFETIGLEPTYLTGEGGKDVCCYMRSQGVYIAVGGRKISGGAQRRTQDGILQHGTVIIDRDEDRMAAVFREDVGKIREKVTSLKEEGVELDRHRLQVAVFRGYEAALGVDLELSKAPIAFA
ncbi:MAG: lipoate--protein ligase family protein [Euryarchaeota archaeon]|nr:lipoate--protein ligase family protein [Euryarchaeota archaeon]